MDVDYLGKKSWLVISSTSVSEWDPHEVFSTAKKISDSSSNIQMKMADFEITLIFDNCHIKSNPCFSAGPTGCCYLLKLPIQDFEQEDGVYSAAAFPFRDVRPREKPANGTLAYYICKAQCPGTGGTGFWLIPHMFQMMQVLWPSCLISNVGSTTQYIKLSSMNCRKVRRTLLFNGKTSSTLQ